VLTQLELIWHSKSSLILKQRLQYIIEVAKHKIYFNLTFRGTYIVIYSCNKIKVMHLFLKFIFGIKLYMFRIVTLSIIRSLALYTQQ
jgi:hypothetical protein